MRSTLLALVVSTMFFSTAYADPALTTQQKYDALKAKGIFSDSSQLGLDVDKPVLRKEISQAINNIMARNNASPDTALANLNSLPELYKTFFLAAPNGPFNPNGNVTIEELAVVMARAFGPGEIEESKVEGTAGWADPFIKAALQAGLIDSQRDYTHLAKRQDLIAASFSANTLVENNIIAASVALRVKAAPQNAAAIIQAAILQNPKLATQIATEAAKIAPDYAVLIAKTAAQAAPDQGDAIADAVARMVPADKAQLVQQAVAQITQKTPNTTSDPKGGTTPIVISSIPGANSGGGSSNKNIASPAGNLY